MSLKEQLVLGIVLMILFIVFAEELWPFSLMGGFASGILAGRAIALLMFE